jgi:hypothetical protein
VPSFIEANGDQVYIRFQGKNRENWFKRNITAAERFKYLYSERELQSLAKGSRNLEQQGVKRAYAIFNKLLSELWNHECSCDGREPSQPRAIVRAGKVPGLSSKQRRAKETARFVEPMECLPLRSCRVRIGNTKSNSMATGSYWNKYLS